jgi:protein trapped in endoderm-1
LIACHSLYDRIYTRHYIVLQILFAWAFSFSIMLPPLLGVWGRLGYHAPTFSCTILRQNNASPKKFLFVFGFLLPCVVIILSYGCIYWKVRRSRLKLQAHKY